MSLNPLDRAARLYADEFEAAAVEVVRSGWYILGKRYEQFCREFASFCSADFCVGVGNGTDAIEIALRAVGVERGHEVITVANAGMYTSTAVAAIGATPVYVDIDPVTHLMDAELLAAAISDRTHAVVITHLYGAPADVNAVRDAVGDRAIALVEDCAQAHGAFYHGQRVGSLGDISAFSFYPTKNLAAMGDGGAVVTSSLDLVQRARSIAQYGWSTERFRSELAGGRNSRLDEMQAALLSVNLPHLDELNLARRSVHARYSEALTSSSSARLLHANTESVCHLAVLETADRDSAARHFREHGIQTAVHYPIPDHMQPSMADTFVISGGLSVTERAARHVLTVPCHPFMTPDEVDRVVRALEEL